MSFESPARKTERPEPGPEREPIRKEYEYRDSEGRLLGRAVAELDIELVDVKRENGGILGKGRRLRSLVLEGEKDGKPSRLDLLELANPHDVMVFVKDARSFGNYYEPSGDAVLSDPLGTPTDVGVLLHELGHADQWRDKHLAALTPLYGTKDVRRVFYSPYAVMKEVLKAVAETVPNAESLADRKTLERLEEMEARLDFVENEKKQLEDGLMELQGKRMARSAQALALHRQGGKIPPEFEAETRRLEANIAGVERRIQELEKEADKIERMQTRVMEETMDVKAILALPTKILERDATARALRWLRTIRDRTGIDLLRPHAIEERAMIGGKERLNDCRSYVVVGLRGGEAKVAPETTVLEELKQALGTYRAGKLGDVRSKSKRKKT